MIQYFKEKITPSELAELNAQRAASPVKDEQFKRLTSLPWIISRLQEMDSDKKAGWQTILEKAKTRKRQID